jgi:SAM-dependent methyltransferase
VEGKMTCNSCNSNQRKLLWNIGNFQIFKCISCGLVYCEVKKSDIDGAYEEDYYKKVYPDYEADKKVFDKNHQLMLSEIEKISTKGKMLEVGCAFGFFLASAEKMGWETQGFEISKYASQIAINNYKINVKNVDFLSEPSVSNMYDVVCLFDTIEHLLDPNVVIEKVAKELKPGGKIVITTGDINSIHAKVLRKKWRLLAPPLHIYYYSPESITYLLQKHGFSIVSITHKGKYQNIGSIVQLLFGISKKKIPMIPIKVNVGDIMTVIANKNN